MRKITMDTAIRELDKLFHIKDISDEVIPGRSWRDNENTYFISTNDYDNDEVLDMLHNYFRELIVEDTICDLLDKDDEYTIFILR